MVLIFHFKCSRLWSRTTWKYAQQYTLTMFSNLDLRHTFIEQFSNRFFRSNQSQLSWPPAATRIAYTEPNTCYQWKARETLTQHVQLSSAHRKHLRGKTHVFGTCQVSARQNIQTAQSSRKPKLQLFWVFHLIPVQKRSQTLRLVYSTCCETVKNVFWATVLQFERSLANRSFQHRQAVQK